MIEVHGLRKVYGNYVAIENLDFSICGNGVYGFLGPNGAGKSTTMNILAGCLAPTSGEVRINGFDIQRYPKQAKASVGYLPEIPPVYPDMTPWEYLAFVAEAMGVPARMREVQIREAMERTGISNVANRLCRQLSKGYRQRVGISQALLGTPKLIILDEPMVGLDPRQIREIRELIEDLGREHMVLLSSHILPEVRSVCKHILIIANGRLIANDTPENLVKQYAGLYQLHLRIRISREEAAQILSELPCVHSYEITEEENGIVAVTAQTEPETQEATFFAFANRRRPILEMTASQTSLENVFLELTLDAVSRKGEERQ